MLTVLARTEVRALLAKCGPALDLSDNPFATADFAALLLEHVARDDWKIAVVEQGKSLALLYAESGKPGHWQALTNYYASQFSPWAGQKSDTAPSLATALSSIGSSHTVKLAPLSDADADDLAQDFRGTGWFVRPYSCFGNWYQPCAGLSFDEYMTNRPSQTLNTWRRKAKKFAAAGSEARLELVTDPADVPRAMEAYGRVYAKSWKVPEPYPGFVPGWALRCAERGWLRLGLAWVSDVPVAAQFWFTRNGRAYIFKLAYDEEFSRYSAGTVLSAFMFRQALEVDRVREIDYLTGDDAYKRAWMSHRRERLGLVACNLRSARGFARAAYEWVGMARQRIKQASSPANAVGVDASALPREARQTPDQAPLKSEQ
jgi:hypothetical protein